MILVVFLFLASILAGVVGLHLYNKRQDIKQRNAALEEWRKRIKREST